MHGRMRMKKLSRLLKQSPRVWWMAVSALWLTGYYRWRLLHTPFEKLSPRIGELYLETPTEEIESPVLQEVRYAVTGVSRYTPWESKCLVQALTAKTLLNRYRLPCTLYMGLHKTGQGKMLAHAWLRCGNRLITGGQVCHLYTVTAYYGDRE